MLKLGVDAYSFFYGARSWAFQKFGPNFLTKPGSDRVLIGYWLSYMDIQLLLCYVTCTR